MFLLTEQTSHLDHAINTTITLRIFWSIQWKLAFKPLMLLLVKYSRTNLNSECNKNRENFCVFCYLPLECHFFLYFYSFALQNLEIFLPTFFSPAVINDPYITAHFSLFPAFRFALMVLSFNGYFSILNNSRLF